MPVTIMGVMIARLEDLHEMVGESVEDLLRQQGLDLTDTSSVIYLSGSLVEGHGHGTSDVDVYVIGDDEPRGPLNIVVENYQVAIDFGRCRRVDYEYWTPPAVAALAEKLANLDLGRGFLGVLHDAEEEFLHRLRVGVPLTQPEGFRRVQDAFDFDRLRRYLRT